MVLAVDSDGKKRCFGSGEGKNYYTHYHDEEWGVPEHDDQKLFGKLILDGAQAGLSWDTILQKREGYMRLFHQFNIEYVASMTDGELATALEDKGIVRNRLKVHSARTNARVCLQIIEECGSFNDYIWSFVDGKTIINHWEDYKDVPVSTKESDALSRDLKKRGMKFVGTTIIYAYMQAVGLIYDHLTDCWRYERDIIGKIAI